jgi:hypothetical protein
MDGIGRPIVRSKICASQQAINFNRNISTKQRFDIRTPNSE